MHQPSAPEARSHAYLPNVTDARLAAVDEGAALSSAAHAGQASIRHVACKQYLAWFAHDGRTQVIVGLARKSDGDRAGHGHGACELANVRFVIKCCPAEPKVLQCAHRTPRRIPCFLSASRRNSGLYTQ